MIKIVCMGYKDADDQTVPCGKVLGEKEGGDGDSHTYCDDCFKNQMDAASECLKALDSFVDGDSKRMKVIRVQAIAQGKSTYESAA